jgi:RNA polymerase sigma factor (sigma-70 family)
MRLGLTRTVNPLTILELAERCRAEAERYKETRQAVTGSCFELFRQALVEQNQAAWEALYTQYHALVIHWVFSYSRFVETGEDAAFFVNEAFSRMWQYIAKPDMAERFDKLGKCLNYLKLCVGSAIEDYLRRKQKDALATAVALQEHDQLTLSPQAQIEAELTSLELSRMLEESLQDHRERLVAEETWVYNLAPRQIQARYPEIFTTTEEVSQVRRNIIKRLQRKLQKRAVPLQSSG